MPPKEAPAYVRLRGTFVKVARSLEWSREARRDLIQIAKIKVHKVQAHKPQASDSYLTRTGINAMTTEVRRWGDERRRVATVQGRGGFEAKREGPETEELLDLAAVVDRLELERPRLGVVVRLYGEGMGVGEIASHLGLSFNGTKSRLHRGILAARAIAGRGTLAE